MPIVRWDGDPDHQFGYDRLGVAIAAVRYNGRRTMACYRLEGLRRAGARVNVPQSSWEGDKREEARAWCQFILTTHAGIV